MDSDLHEEPIEQIESGSDINRRELQLEEYKTLSKEIAARMKEIADLERYSVLGIVGYYAWLIGPPQKQFPKTFWWVPVVIALFVMACHNIYLSSQQHIIETHCMYREEIRAQRRL
jgi:hypothetical protein